MVNFKQAKHNFKTTAKKKQLKTNKKGTKTYRNTLSITIK